MALYTCKYISHCNEWHFGETHLGDRSSTYRGFVDLLEYMIQGTLEYPLEDSLGIPKGVRFPIRMKASQTLAQRRREEVNPRACPLGELKWQEFRILVHGT